MTYFALIFLFFFPPLLVLLTATWTQTAWYRNLKRRIWHRQLIKKIEKKLEEASQRRKF